MTKGLLFVALDPIKKGSDPAIKGSSGTEVEPAKAKETDSVTNTFHADGDEKELSVSQAYSFKE